MRLATAATLALLLGACSFSPPREPAPSTPPASVPPRSTPPRDLSTIPDAVPRHEPRSARGNPASYEVLGRRYHVLASAEGYKERGVASWYGPDFHNKATSSGEPYDMYAMTAAHKTLPIPAYARVTNLANGRSVVVRINDRGPFVANRIIDLSYTAAHKLDMTRAGTVFVEVEVLTPESTADAPRPVAAGGSRLYLQTGAFGAAGNARNLAARLTAAGISNVAVVEPDRSSALHRVRIGPIADVATFDMLAERVAQLGFDTLLVSE
jgi:rare lipoprotein A